MFISGSVFQTFLAESGIAEERIAGIVSFMTVVQLVIMLFASGKIGRVKYIVSFTVWIQTAHIPMLLFFMFGCLSGNLSSRYDYYILIAAVFVSELGFGLYNILIYKFPYHIIDMDKYGNLMAVSGVIGGIVTLLLSVILSYFQEKFSYFSVMFGMFVFVLLTIGVYAYVTGSVKKIKVKEERKREKSRKILLWKYPPFYKLLLPNLGRGFCSGAVTMMVTVGYYFNILNAKTAGILVIISSAMTFLSCIVYPTLANKYKEKNLILLSSVALVISMPLMLTGRNLIVFLAGYAVTYFCFNMINYAVPADVVYLIDYEIAGQYSGYRMTLHNLGTAAFGAVSIFLLSHIGGFFTMLLAAGFQLYSGIVYYQCLKNKEKENKNKEEALYV